jgi:hypothetical protein
MRYERTDDEWEAIKPMPQKKRKKTRGIPRMNDRRVLSDISGYRGAIFHGLRPHTTC